ncbi:MAG: hypothetical protein ABIG40_03435 [Parcubacteria group bacterium]
MKRFSVTTIFWALIVVFAIIIGNMMLFPSFLPESLRMYMIYIMFVSWAVSFVLGLVLIVSTVKQKVEGALKKFLLLAGASAVGFPLFAVLHNLVSALLGVEEPFFFILAAIVCPLGFLVGVIGTITLFYKKKKLDKT